MTTRALPRFHPAGPGPISHDDGFSRASAPGLVTSDLPSLGDRSSRRRLHKSPADPGRASSGKRDSMAKPPDAPTAESTAFGLHRQPSTRTHLAPQGARPLVRSPSKRNGPTTSHPPGSFSVRPSEPSLTSTSASNNNSSTLDWFQPDMSTVAAATATGSERSKPMLPELQFDDFHAKVTGDSRAGRNLSAARPQAAVTAAQGASHGFEKAMAAQSHRSNERGYGQGNVLTSRRPQPTTTRDRGQQQQQQQQQQQPWKAKSTTTSSDNKAALSVADTRQQRRTSYFSTHEPRTHVPQSARKSMGPGALYVDPAEANALLQTPLNSRIRRDDRRTAANGHQEASVRAVTMPTTMPATTNDATGSTTAAVRSQRRKSIQVPKTALSATNSPRTPDSPWDRSSGAIGSSVPRSPGARESLYGATTPSSSKRLSTMPGHATGLGARTVSPTDARRLKRLSMASGAAPPLPTTPPITVPDVPSSGNTLNGRRSATDSPLAPPPRKSTTPSSSNRNTPDPARRSVNFSTPTINNLTLRANGPVPRLPSTAPTSRLPTPRTKADPVAEPAPENVPPVPAIPKAYESPQTEIDVPFFAHVRSNSKPLDANSVNSGSTNDNASIFSALSGEKDFSRSNTDVREARTPLEPTVAAAHATHDLERASGAQDGRRTIQPIRLPALSTNNSRNPSGTTASRAPATSAAARSDNSTRRDTTPPLAVRAPTKPPSTPMTATKAMFFSRSKQASNDNAPEPLKIRSSSSHHISRPEPSPYRAPSTASSLHGPVDSTPRPTTSPFISASLPKGSAEVHARSRADSYRSISTIGIDTKPIRPAGPRAQSSAKSLHTEAVSQRSTPVDGESSSFGSTLRRKLSFTRKRSASKAEGERPPQPSDHEIMPPPKVPASATWTGAPVEPPATTTPKTSFLHVRRKSSFTSNQKRHERAKSEVYLSDTISGEKPPSSIPALTGGQVSTSSLLPFTSNSRSLLTNGIRSGPREARLENHSTDRDDALAEEEMKHLASRRKNTEQAARQLDELRRRAAPKQRLSPSQALRSARLNIFERGEIVDFKDVYFCGSHAAQKHTGDLGSERANFGYDDERGDYNIVKGDHLAYRYEVVDVLGKGSFGQVVRCVDHKTGGLVAVKIIRNKKRFHQQALVEVNILQKIREWDPDNRHSMVRFTQSFYFRGHLCISTELLGMNLYEFIKAHDFKGFSLRLIRRFTKQMLSSLILLKSRRVIHCDLKPENILLTHPARAEIKVIDFGSSCLENEKVYTYIQSRFYRSPEVILGMNYGLPIDMWSLGCILAELLTGYPIFPGENEQEQLSCIMEIFGPPERHLIEKSSRRKLFFDSAGKPRLTVSSKGKRRRPSAKTLAQALKCDDEAFLDFLARCLRWDPERRLKPDEAIYHDFITGVKPSSSRGSRPFPPPGVANSSSPIKRFNSMHTPGSAPRPLPDPGNTAFRSNAQARPREASEGSPVKTASRRLSTMPVSAIPTGAPVRKMTNGTTANAPMSALPKPGTRALSGRTGLASAAAAAASTVRQVDGSIDVRR